MIIALVALLLLAAGLLSYWQQADADRWASERIDSSVKMLAARFSDLTALYTRILQGLRSDPSIMALFAKGDRAALERRAKTLARLIPQASRVRLILPEEIEPQGALSSKLGFAAIDLLQRAARKGRVMPAEVHKYGGPGAHIALAAGVASANDGVSGLIHVSFPLNAVVKRLAERHDYGGRIELQQQVNNGKLLVFGSAGPAVDEKAAPDSREPIAHSIWQVAGWRVQGGAFSPPMIRLWATTGALVLLTALIAGGIMSRLGRRLNQDLGNIVKLNDRVVSGKGIKRYSMHLRETGAAQDLLAQRLRETGMQAPRVSGKRAATAADAGKPPTEEMPPLPIGVEEMEAEHAPVTAFEDFATEPEAEKAAVPVPEIIFREYDIRGRVGEELNSDVAFEIGRAVGSEAQAIGQPSIIVGRDGRTGSAGLAEALIRGLRASGRDVSDIGEVATPVLYFGTYFLDSNSGVMVTGSHNPPEYNGFKVVLDQAALSGERIRDLHRRLMEGDLSRGEGALDSQDLIPDYIKRITDDVRLVRPLKVVVDCGNGAAGPVAPELLKALGCEVTPLYCEVDGRFPHHHPDPSRVENLRDLIDAVRAEGADLGIALDGDGDRIGVIDSSGKIIWPDRLLMLFARDVLARQPGGDILYDVKSTHHLASDILMHGGRPVMWKTGHSLLKQKLRETGALLAGELSGHIVFQERWYGFDDALYTAARLLEILAMEPRPSADVFAELPESPATPELQLSMQEGAPQALMQRLAAEADFGDARLVILDGIRAEYEDGWGLVRASNTTPSLVFRFEGQDEKALARIQEVFRTRIERIEPGLALPF